MHEKNEAYLNSNEKIEEVLSVDIKSTKVVTINDQKTVINTKQYSHATH